MTIPQPHSYAIFEAHDTESLAHLVNEAQKHGWRPQGGIAVAPAIADGITVGSRYLQFMVQSTPATQ
jgi:hypothetical protein